MAQHDASDAEVEEACKLAHVHSVIIDPTKIQHGYDTVVDVQVPSGGQKRLIAWRAACYASPKCFSWTSQRRTWTPISERG